MTTKRVSLKISILFIFTLLVGVYGSKYHCETLCPDSRGYDKPITTRLFVKIGPSGSFDEIAYRLGIKNYSYIGNDWVVLDAQDCTRLNELFKEIPAEPGVSKVVKDAIRKPIPR